MTLFAFISCDISDSDNNEIKNSKIQEKYIENATLEEDFDFFVNNELFIVNDTFQKVIEKEAGKTSANSVEVFNTINKYLKAKWKPQIKIFEFTTEEQSNLLIEIYNNSYIDNSIEFIEIKDNWYFYVGELVTTLKIRNHMLNENGFLEKKFTSKGLIKSTAPLE